MPCCGRLVSLAYLLISDVQVTCYATNQPTCLLLTASNCVY